MSEQKSREGITQKEFDSILFDFVQASTPGAIMAIGPVYSALAEYYNNLIIDEWERSAEERAEAATWTGYCGYNWRFVDSGDPATLKIEIVDYQGAEIVASPIHGSDRELMITTAKHAINRCMYVFDF